MLDATLVPEGDDVQLTVAWSSANGIAEIPTAVRYQVFDVRGVSVSGIVAVAPVAASMVFAVLATSLPVASNSIRTLLIQIEATFPGGGKHTEKIPVRIVRRHAFA